ncbi:hypothetical protein CAP35_01840 [Chitinophagaceae bacterium IBVUCB1]|nr:hypothetical protein CAP35_01840 [Chitinophagaceae bacterium IBVUCB1]
MQRIFFTFLLFLFAFTANAQQVYPVVFYNLENLFDTVNDPLTDDDEFTPTGNYRYTDKIYKQKLRNMAYALQRAGTDKSPKGASIIGLAEVENNTVLNALIAQPELKARGYKYVWYNSTDPRGIDVAILYNPAHFKVIASRQLNVRKGAREPLYVKGVLAGDTLHILVNHWPSRKDGADETEHKRKEMAAANRKLIDEIRRINSNAKIVLMGDLNDNPDNESLTQVLGATANQDNVGNNTLFNPFAAMYASGKGTAVFQRRWDLFDQIVLTAGFVKNKGLQYAGAEIYDRPFLRQETGKFRNYPFRSFRGTYWNNGYSDHFPVIVYLKK